MPRPTRLSDTERDAAFREKVKPVPSGCHEWQALLLEPSGYGQFWDGERMVLAHKWAYLRFVGHVPDGLCVLHSCDNRRCVNPEHLFLGTNQDNTDDAVKKGRIVRKLTPEKKKYMIELLTQGWLQREVAAELQVHPSLVSRHYLLWLRGK